MSKASRDLADPGARYPAIGLKKSGSPERRRPGCPASLSGQPLRMSGGGRRERKGGEWLIKLGVVVHA